MATVPAEEDMQAQHSSELVADPVPKINNELAVGEDVAFQRRWWSFERAVFIVFVIIIVLDLVGAFGRGYLAHGDRLISDGVARLKYERIERAGTPSILSIEFSPQSVREGKVSLWLSETITQGLGNQRIIPQPVTSTLQNGGIHYDFPVSGLPATAQFALQPAHPGLFELTIRVGNGSATRVPILVMP